MGHTRARYFGPETGGLIFNNDVGGDSVFRIDHDQAFQQTTNLRYQHGHEPVRGSRSPGATTAAW